MLTEPPLQRNKSRTPLATQSALGSLESALVYLGIRVIWTAPGLWEPSGQKHERPDAFVKVVVSMVYPCVKSMLLKSLEVTRSSLSQDLSSHNGGLPVASLVQVLARGSTALRGIKTAGPFWVKIKNTLPIDLFDFVCRCCRSYSNKSKVATKSA
jgi:hypothetical protein